MHIRLAHVDDLAAIDEIYNHYVMHSTCTAQYEPTTPEERRAWFDAHAAARHPILVAERDGHGVLGWASLSTYNARHGYRYTVEDSIYVRHDERGHGLGRALLGELLERGRAGGHKHVIASIAGDQEASIALHARAGFVEMGRLREIVVKLERWLDVVYMQRTL